jgi:tRNA(fMet)-specific endonuclease VapC
MVQSALHEVWHMMIAAHVLSAEAVLVTDNYRHYERIKAPLLLANWV